MNYILILVIFFLSSCVVKPDAAVQEAYDLDVVKLIVNGAPVPGNRGLVRITALGPEFISLSFELASDDHTAKADLSYKLISTTSDNFANPQVVFNWTKLSLGSYQVGLSDFKARVYKLLVRDSANKEASYLLFTHAPILPESAAIKYEKTSALTAKLSWTKSSHLYIDSSALQYKVVKSSLNNISTIADAEANGLVEIDWTNDLSDLTISGLVEGNRYYFTVLVRTPFAVVQQYSVLEKTF